MTPNFTAEQLWTLAQTEIVTLNNALALYQPSVPQRQQMSVRLLLYNILTVFSRRDDDPEEMDTRLDRLWLIHLFFLSSGICTFIFQGTDIDDLVVTGRAVTA